MPSPASQSHETGIPLPGGYLSIDLEVHPKKDRILKLAAINSETGERLVFTGGGNIHTEVLKLDRMADRASCLTGHNLIAFDLPHLQAINPGLKLLRMPALDTLMLSPLAFPENPYHKLIKHYQDASLIRGQVNDPELDARLALEVLQAEFDALRESPAQLLACWHWLATMDGSGPGFDLFFSSVRRSDRPADADAFSAIADLLAGMGCRNHCGAILENRAEQGWPLAYALAWLSVCGGNSVVPPWVVHQFPDTLRIIRKLRDTACADPACEWCRERHDPVGELKRWFGFPGFRPEPRDDSGQSMQQAIVRCAMSHESVLGLLPTGTGKSLCYQIPALSRYDKTGALTVVISPLVALMADQVSGLEKRGIASCVTVNGTLSMPERNDALDRVRLGDAGILIISPEQLRSASVRRVLDQRNIGLWVMDEAHCLSKWGHDFRPDYRYVGRFIREKSRQARRGTSPVMCLTATAKPDVVQDIVQYFRKELDLDLRVMNGGSERTNLSFEVMPSTPDSKFSHVHQVLEAELSAHEKGGAIVYCATRRGTEELTEYLQAKNIDARHFHGTLSPEIKKEVQQRFIGGELRVIAATNAFGMGIDKEDVRLVIHADIPGSLENYLQEAGRAGRDGKSARCVLFYTPEDVERQFGMTARSRLTHWEIVSVMKALCKIDRRNRGQHDIVATTGEILLEDDEQGIERDANTDDTRVRTAVAWLEESDLLTREENKVRIFPSSLQVQSREEAHDKLSGNPNLTNKYRGQLLAITEVLINSEPDKGVTTDELMLRSGLDSKGIRTALCNMESLGIARNDTAITAFVHHGIARHSRKRFEEATALEKALTGHLRVLAPDMRPNDAHKLHLRSISQALRDEDIPNPLPERILRILRSLQTDGRDEDGGKGSLQMRIMNGELVEITLQREWDNLEKIAELRRTAAYLLLGHLLSTLPPGSRGADLLAETTMGSLLHAITSDLELRNSGKRKFDRLMDRALLWTHEQEVIRLNKGLAVFRPAMTIRINRDHPLPRFTKADFQPLSLHYDDQVTQIHVMSEFAQRGLDSMADAIRLTTDYFNLGKDAFLGRWFPERARELGRQLTPDSWNRIVESLNNPVQRNIVIDNREQTNVLVLAGPGSGKTRALTHRVAYLIRAKRENPRGILVLTYNRHSALDIRRRLEELIGRDARGAIVMTCDALAMRLVGATFRDRTDVADSNLFQEIMKQAITLLQGKGLEEEDADEQRERLLAGFRWILVDEYQDINQLQYDLIAALAGRTLRREDSKKLAVFAVGDDDQNVYAFNGTSVEFIRCFQADYGPNPVYMIENYRSSGHIIEAANALIAPARERMKTDHPIRVNRVRAKESPGGDWTDRDPVSHGRVQILDAGRNPASQAQAVMLEFQRLAGLCPDLDWSSCAVIAREWKYLDPVRAWCELHSVPVQMGNEEIPNFWRLRETQALVRFLKDDRERSVARDRLRDFIHNGIPGPWTTLLEQAAGEYILERGNDEVVIVGDFLEWLAEWGRAVRRSQNGLLLVTAHGAKGLEFDHVSVLDGGWERKGRDEDDDAPRRLFYVAMTRARQTLVLARFRTPDPGVASAAPAAAGPVPANPLLSVLEDSPPVLWRSPVGIPAPAPELSRRYRQLKMNDVDLSHAGRQAPSNRIHAAIGSLRPGDPLVLYRVNGRWALAVRSGSREVVGFLSAGFRPPEGMKWKSARVHAIVTWGRGQQDPQYLSSIRCECWEVVIPELVFEPE